LFQHLKEWLTGQETIAAVRAQKTKMGNTMRQQLIDVLREAAGAHRTSPAASEAADPDWPIHYADYLHPHTAGLGLEFTRSELASFLIAAEQERSARAPDAPWPDFYADFFVARFSPSREPNTDTLALYSTPYCPFTFGVVSAIDRLGLNVEFRDIFSDPAHREALVAARGRARVPVLRITSKDDDTWMPESRDIIRYLEKTYG
jgi:hypothetical protein